MNPALNIRKGGVKRHILQRGPNILIKQDKAFIIIPGDADNKVQGVWHRISLHL